MNRRTFSLVVLCASLAWGGVAGAMESPYPRAAGAGKVEALNFGDNSMIVGGLRYRVAPDVQVEIGGSYGAFTMLRPGMRIRFDYMVVSSTERVLVRIQELPGDVVLEET